MKTVLSKKKYQTLDTVGEMKRNHKWICFKNVGHLVMSNFYSVSGVDLFFQYKEYIINKMAYTAKDPHPPPLPQCFLYLTETKSWKWEVGRRRRRKSQSEDPHYHKGHG